MHKEPTQTETNRSDDISARMEKIQRMLIEVANGNFGYKVERSDQNDELEALAVVVNMMAEEMKGAFSSLDHPSEAYKPVAGVTFVLDRDFNIQGFNPSVPEILFYETSALIGEAFARLLTDESQPLMKVVTLHCSRQQDFHLTIELSFKTGKGLVVPMSCSVSPLIKAGGRENIIITGIASLPANKVEEQELRYLIGLTRQGDGEEEDGKRNKISMRGSDIRKIQDIKEYLQANLDITPSLKDLSHTFAINEFKLKHGFKQVHGCTVFHFLMEERLKKASLLLQNTDIPLKNVAEITGFKSFPHFSKAFKKRFGYSPSNLKRISVNR